LNLSGRGGGRGVCVGNSSSGIKETPALGCPAVNIGSRQQGRLRAENVIDVGYDRAEILAATRRGLFDEDFRRLSRVCTNPYGVGDAGRKIAEVLARVELGSSLIKKKMTI
jgi:UDP-N-acetylglucosamine 2-epimerase (non-hydrolysing)/GDP/UDP-N,N'-diacetylbacillosamine 2-epimerase (hydrolysing)